MRSILRPLGFFTLLVCLAVRIGFTQPRWTLQHPLPTPMALNDVCFIDKWTGVAVGEAGTIIRTTDGGTTWDQPASGTLQNLNRIVFSGTLRATIVGDGGTVLHTTNAGTTWLPQVSGPESYLYAVCSMNASNIIVAGYDAVGSKGSIYRTTDGGATWERRTSGTTAALRGVTFFDDSIGLAVGGLGIVLRTSDGGASWTRQQIGGGSPELYDVCAINGSSAIAVGAAIFRTDDRGITWIWKTDITSDCPTRVSFINPDTGIAVAGNDLLRTFNGGNTWSRLSLGTTRWYGGLSFIDERNIAVVGENGVMIRSTDGGTTWESQNDGATAPLYGVSFSDAATGTAVGAEGSILRTTNAGITWVVQRSATNQSLNAIACPDALDGTAVGTDGAGRALILRTTNGGTTWTERLFNVPDTFNAVCFTDATTGTVVGTGGTILRTTDGGTSWLNQTSGSGARLYGVSFYDALRGLAVGDSGVVLRTTDGGLHWARQPSGTKYGLGCVVFLDSSIALAARDVDSLFRTTDGGSTWKGSRPFSGLRHFTGICAARRLAAYAVGWMGKIHSGGAFVLRTTDGGESWSEVYTLPPDLRLYDVSFTDRNNGTVVGARGIILRTTNGGATWVEHEKTATPPLSSSCTLLQNFPNPFNPSSDIRYQISEFSNVFLSVYDLLGREVAVLVNEKKNPGTYTVTWNAAGMASGVYICRMVTGTSMQSRKMLLVK
jgi:photosystem II stability/assembly factor-like uncharacterized protein